MKTVYIIISLLFSKFSFEQDIKVQLNKALDNLEKDSQFTHAIISMYVADSKTGKPVYEKNSRIGLVPASCQKIVTSCAAFELLEKDYTYKTVVKMSGGPDSIHLFIVGSGDPTIGSWRWPQTEMAMIYKNILTAFL